MPGVRRQRVAYEDEEGEDGGLSDAASSTVSGGSSSKRARLSVAKDISKPGLLNSQRTEANATVHHNVQNASEQHQPGTIVRVKLTNFVTYTSAEFNPGPSLNMIIGPNGTGKSTLVCAICLGLGWGPQHLGRAKDLGEFVKHGAREAEIEIELKAGPAQQHGQNPIVKRKILREGNKTHWSLNGRTSSQKLVQSLCRSFSIQVDNLCQFLPQDRVVEFAALNPVELLVQTQRAAAPEYMSIWHEKLNEMRNEQKKSITEQAALDETLKSLENRQNMQRPDIERMRERARVVSRVAAFEKMRPIPEYRVARDQVGVLKAQRKKAQDELKTLEQAVEPALRAVNHKQEYVKSIDRTLDSRKRLFEMNTKRADDMRKKNDELVKALEECQSKESSEKKSRRQEKQQEDQCQREMTNLKNRMTGRPLDFDAAAYNEKIRERARQIRDLETKADDLRDKLKEINDVVQQRKVIANEKQNEVERSKSQAGQQLRKLQLASPDSFKLYQWLQKHTGEFQHKVYGPPIVECTIKDMRFADSIESMLQKGDLQAFTCTNRADFRKLQDAFNQLRLGDINVRAVETGLDTFQAPVSKDSMRDLGLDAFLVDVIEGPDPVLAMLCDNAKIHMAGVVYGDLSNAQYDALAQSQIASFVDKSKTYQITRRREYGPQAMSTRVRDVRPAKIWTASTGDPQVEQAARQEIAVLNDEVAELEQDQNEIRKQGRQLVEQKKRLQEEKDQLENDKGAAQRALAEFNALPTKLAVQERRMEGFRTKADEFRQRMEVIESRRDKISLERGQLAIDYATQVEGLRKAHNDLLSVAIMHVEGKSELDHVIRANQETKDSLDARKSELLLLDRESDQVKENARRLLGEVKAMLDARTNEEKELQETMPEGQTPDELEAIIESERSKLEMLHEGNPQIIQDFEERERKIERLRQKIEDVISSLSKVDEKIQEIRAQWEPELDRLIGHISDAFAGNFARIGCAGQVSVRKDDDFENWAIQIMVKFRENEPLTLLDSHRQSGGERAVSTIFYLMALQTLARAPFRVVDEINQGMDPRNERIVHERMVDIACGEPDGPPTSQYFLITPKLLSGLKYRRGMKVHCIASGEHMPTDWKQLDFQEAIRVLKAEQANGVTSGASPLAVKG